MRRILVVDDDLAYLDAVRELLTEEGYEVVALQSAARGMEFLYQNPQTSLVILDLQMPDMDGYTFRRWQLADRDVADIPVLVLSAQTHGIRIKAQQVLDKSVNATFLLNAVAATAR